MKEKEWNPATVFDVFGDSLSRQILLLANECPISAKELADRLDVSPPTVYRRTDELIGHDFVREHRRIDENGNHYRTFETTLSRVEFGIEDGGYNVDIRLRENLVDSFETFWSELEESSTRESVGSAGQADRTDAHNDTSPT